MNTTNLSKKKIILFSEDEELYRAFRRALKSVGRITVFRFSEDSLKNKNKAILLITSEEKGQELIYEKIRAKYLNPVLIIGFKNKELFEKEHPLFCDHPYNHTYVSIPFDLFNLVGLLNEAIPISSQAIRKAICGDDLGYKGYLFKLLSHDLLKSNGRCVEILKISGDYLKDKYLSIEINNAIEKIKKRENGWSVIASIIGKKLEKKIRNDCNG